ncbi:MAG: hypothetical protein RLZZ630_329 [Bacteroidota bacterium]
MRFAVIGGGAAGFFASIRLRELRPDSEVHLFEKSAQVLAKVKVSGGGRCNVTHACFEARELIRNYPRGNPELIGAFSRFGPAQTVEWFEDRGVDLKTEEDGRMFPITDSSQTIIDLFLSEAQSNGVLLHRKTGLKTLKQSEANRWSLEFDDDSKWEFDAVLISTGSSESVWKSLMALGMEIRPPVPSLFTFHVRDKELQSLMGLSVAQVRLVIPETGFESSGPLLFTHWGLSGPAVLKLSAFAARDLHSKAYRFRLTIDFLPDLKESRVEETLRDFRSTNARRQVINAIPFHSIPKRCWGYLLLIAGIDSEKNWADLGNKHLHALLNAMKSLELDINGKSTFKEEFVTCGGVSLDEVDTRSFQAKRFPGLYFAGEVLNVDAVTGGFNFQHAWTSGWLAAGGMASI